MNYYRVLIQTGKPIPDDYTDPLPLPVGFVNPVQVGHRIRLNYRWDGASESSRLYRVEDMQHIGVRHNDMLSPEPESILYVVKLDGTPALRPTHVLEPFEQDRE